MSFVAWPVYRSKDDLAVGQVSKGAGMTSSVTVDIFVSVDGWAGSDGLPAYFGYLGPELEDWITNEAAAPQTLVLGRRTYEALAGMPDRPGDENWQRMMQTDKIVFSTTLRQTVWPNTRICDADLAEEIRKMKTDSDLPMRTMGSLSVVRQLLGAGLVDRLRLMTFPLIAGDSGREAFFADVAAADLELVDCRRLDNRVLLVEYRPTGKDIPRA
jgi:dihydrofolate reductase